MIFNLAIVMNKWHDKQQAFLDPDFKKPRPLTLEELETLPMSEVVGTLKDEIINAIVTSQETEIPLKKTEETTATSEG